MAKRDARALTPEAQEELRFRAIAMLKEGIKGYKVAELLEVHAATVSKWKVQTETSGLASLKKQRRGFAKGERGKLTKAQKALVIKVITDRTPDQLKLSYALWTAAAVALYIEQEFQVRYSASHMAALLKEWGFTSQRPLKRAYEQRPEQIQQWMEERFPKIKDDAKQQDAEIWWGDEAAVQPAAHHLQGYSPKGQTPVLRQPAQRFHSSYISALSNSGKLHWMGL